MDDFSISYDKGPSFATPPINLKQLGRQAIEETHDGPGINVGLKASGDSMSMEGYRDHWSKATNYLFVGKLKSMQWTCSLVGIGETSGVPRGFFSLAILK